MVEQCTYCKEFLPNEDLRKLHIIAKHPNKLNLDIAMNNYYDKLEKPKDDLVNAFIDTLKKGKRA